MYRPADFGSECPPPRPIGTETEYYDKNEFSQDEISKRMAALGFSGVGSFYSNGARIYPYQGIEYAAPECCGPQQAADADFEGITMMRELTKPTYETKNGTKPFPVLRLSGSYSPIKKNIDSRGYHENLLTPYPNDGEKRARLKSLLSSFLATRIIWNGSGLVIEGSYLLSQKASGIGTPVVDGYGNRTSHGSKPLAGFMAPDSDANDKISGDWALLEVRSAEAHMSKSQVFMSLATTSLILRLIEQDAINSYNIDDFVIKDPVESHHIINTQLGGGQLRLESGEFATARSLQERFAEAMLQLAERIELPEDEQESAERLLDICQKLGKLSLPDDLEPLILDVEWAAKLYYLQQMYGENVFADKLKESVAFDLQWHRIDSRSVGLMVYDKYEPTHKDFKKITADCCTLPDSRAAARAKAISSELCTQAVWNKVVLDGEQIWLHDYWDPELPTASGLKLSA